MAIERTHQPVALVLTRQDVPVLDRSRYASAEGLRRGGYVLADPDDGDPELILIATGSEVALAVAAHEELTADGIRSRVVSLPSWELFDQQDDAYRDSVLPPAIGGARLGRGGLDPGLGPLRRAAGREDRHAHLRLLGAAQGRADEVRLHAGASRRDGPRGPRARRLRKSGTNDQRRGIR